MSRRLALAALAVGVVLVGLAAWRAGAGDGAAAYRGSEPPAGIRMPDFALRSYMGEPVGASDLRGSVVLVTFLDTQCTEACPVIAATIARAIDSLGPVDRNRVRAIAITTDPAGDTPASIRAFLTARHALRRLDYLIGSERKLWPVWRRFQVLSSLESGVDTVHSAPVRIYDRDGVWVATQHAGVDLSVDNLVHDLERALG